MLNLRSKQLAVTMVLIGIVAPFWAISAHGNTLGLW
jgi:hypothetical protein